MGELIQRSLRKKPRVLGVGYLELMILAVAFAFLNFMFSEQMLLIVIIVFVLYVVLYWLQKGKPEYHLLDRCFFQLQKGVWYKPNEKCVK